MTIQLHHTDLMGNLPKQLTTVTPFSRYFALSLFVILPILFFFLGAFYSRPTQSNKTHLTPTPATSVSIPVENVLYLAKLDGKDALFYTNESAKRGSSNPYIGEVYVMKSVEYSDFTSDLVFDFRDLDDPLPITTRLPHNLSEISSVLFNNQRDIIYLGIQDEMFIKLYKFNLVESTYELLWSNEMGKGEAYLGNDGQTYIYQNFDDKYLLLGISECHGGCESGEMTYGIMNIETKKVKYLEPIRDDFNVHFDNNTFSYRKRIDVQVSCKDLPEGEQTYGCINGFKTEYHPSNQVFSDILP